MKADGSLLLFQPSLNVIFIHLLCTIKNFRLQTLQTVWGNLHAWGICMLGKALNTKDTYNEINLLDFKGIELYFDIDLLSVHKKVHMNSIFETTWKRRETLHIKCGYRL